MFILTEVIAKVVAFVAGFVPQELSLKVKVANPKYLTTKHVSVA